MESGANIRLHLSSISAEIMPEILFKLAKLTAGTLSFNHLEATSMLKTQPVRTKINHRNEFGQSKDASRPIFFKQKLPSSKMDREQRALDCLGAAKHPCN